MKPSRILRPLNRDAHYATHCDNIALIIACAENIAEADLRIGYYLKVVGVNYCEPESVVEADVPPLMGSIENVVTFPVALDPVAVSALFSGELPPPQPTVIPRQLPPGYEF
jgi:hypothetical protein